MAQAFDLPVPAMTHAELQPIVAQVLGWPQVDVTDWHVSSVAGVAGSVNQGGRGIFRVRGQTPDPEPAPGLASSALMPWSAIVKVFGAPDAAGTPGDSTLNPAASDYWQREILAYRSGLLAAMQGGLAAPRCYGVVEHPRGNGASG